MLGVRDRHDGGAVAHAASPPGDLRDVEHGVAPLDRVGIKAVGTDLDDTVVRPKDQVGYAHVEAAVQSGLPAANRVDPTERDGESAKRLPVEVVVEVAGVVAVQRACRSRPRSACG